MKIVFFQIVPAYGGSFRSLVEFAKRLAEHVDVAVVDVYGACGQFTESVRAAGLEYHVLLPGGELRAIGRHPVKRMMRMAEALPRISEIRRRAVELLEEIKPTVVCSNDLRSTYPVGTARALRDLPLVVHMRGWYTPDMMPFYSRRFANTRCAALLAVSHQTRTALVCSGVDPAKIRVLHNPIDVEEFSALAARPLGRPLPQMERPVRLLLPGTVARTKGLHTAVAALRPLIDFGYDAGLWLAGDLGKGDTAYVRRTQELARELGVGDRVAWLGVRDDMPQVMKAATCVVLPSHSEGHPRVSLEAMALGKPFLATPVGGVLDMVLPGLTGLLFDVEDAAGLAACVDRLQRDPRGARRMVRLAHEYVRDQFAPAQHTREALAIFADVAAQTNARQVHQPAANLLPEP